MTLRDWLELLLVPFLVGVFAAGLTAWFNQQQNLRQQEIEDQRAAAERELAEQRAQDEALQAYLDQMGQLLLEKNLHDSEEGSEVRILARARTLTVLRRLDDTRKGPVIQFLYESGLISAEDGPVVSLRGTDLRGADLSDAALMEADLRETDLSHANLSHANLTGADLSGDVNWNEPGPPRAYLGEDVNLSYADLLGADLSGADLEDAELIGADLREATLIEANLTSASLDDAKLSDAFPQEANLSYAHLVGANLTGADLRALPGWENVEGPNLANADLTDAHVTEEQLAAAKSLKEATMPNGQKYEEWLKSKGRG
jgi:uncharacterized protein YjbI with pentapeptide repeats